MRIAVFYQYYHNPDCALTGRHYSFLTQWARRHEITLITTNVWHERRLTNRFDWVPDGVDVHMLDAPYDNAMDAPGRLAAFARYAVKAVAKGLTTPKPDVILGSSTPLTAAWAAAKTARLRGVPWVFEVRDLWPDFPIEMGAIRRPWLKNRLYALERRLYASAAHLVPLSPDMEAHLLRHGVPPEKVTTVVNGTDFPLLDAWPDERVRALRREHDLMGKKVVLYGGAFGRANDLPALLAAARRLEHREDVRFVFTGHGYAAGAVAEAARRHDNVLHLPPQPRHRMLGWFRLADLSLVSFLGLPVLAANSPAKFFDSLGAGTPVVVTNAGWTRRFVETHGCGWYAPPSEPEALARVIEDALADPERLVEAGRRGHKTAREQFDRETLARRMEDVLTAATRSEAPADAG